MRLDSLSKGNSMMRSRRAWLERAVLVGVASLLLPMAPVVVAEAEAEPLAFAYSVKITPPSEGSVSLINPLPGQPVTSPFGHRKNPFGEGQTRHHDGIDLRADRDSHVLAPADGRVTLATQAEPGREGMGTVLVIDHGGGVETYYAHLESFEVELGEWVREGERIAVPGSTGRSTGRHLHFEVWRGGEKVDPADLVPEWRSE